MMTRRAFLAASAAGCLAEYRRGGMIYRQLGRTDMHISLLSFGSHTDPRYKIKVSDHNILNEEEIGRAHV